MNREIKFRGKTQNSNEWVYGFFYEQKMLYGSHATIIYTVKEPNDWDDEDQKHIHIKRETLGIFTGIKDKLQSDIYDGDIFHCNKVNYILRFNQVGGAYTVHKIGDEKDERFLFHCNDQIEIIGNIHENPELLT